VVEKKQQKLREGHSLFKMFHTSSAKLLLLVGVSSTIIVAHAGIFPRHRQRWYVGSRIHNNHKSCNADEVRECVPTAEVGLLSIMRGGSMPSPGDDNAFFNGQPGNTGHGQDGSYYDKQGQQSGMNRSNEPPTRDNPNSYGDEPDLPPPSFPGDSEPPFPESRGNNGSPNSSSYDRRVPPRQQQQQQQPQQEQRHHQLPSRQPPNRMDPSHNIQQQQNKQLPPESTGGNTPELELETFDKNLIFQGLKRMYRKKILPLEISSKYGHFHSPPLSPSDFDAKPMVLLLGQYSVGKTSFIRYLLGRDFPGCRIGPEPTTDRFTCILDGEIDKVIPGAALCSQGDRPFRGLSPFGNNFLSKLEAVEMDAPILRNITLVDTPGILSGAKQSIGRNYDYDAVMKWFAERSDLIIIMFDAHKLDISDELKRVIEMMKPHADKVRIVLNKADSVSTQQLMRVYGALMWQLGKVMNTPEVCRVYMGSFWGAPLQNAEQAPLLNKEKLDLFQDIAQLPQNAVMRRINELVKRARGVKVHAYIIHYLRKQLPYTFGKREKQARLIDRLDRELIMCARRYELPRGDFPAVEPLRQALLEIKDLSEFPKLDKKMVKEMDKVFSVDIPHLLEKARGEH
jgi:EH domain-containing protein 1